MITWGLIVLLPSVSSRLWQLNSTPNCKWNWKYSSLFSLEINQLLQTFYNSLSMYESLIYASKSSINMRERGMFHKFLKILKSYKRTCSRRERVTTTSPPFYIFFQTSYRYKSMCLFLFAHGLCNHSFMISRDRVLFPLANLVFPGCIKVHSHWNPIFVLKKEKKEKKRKESISHSPPLTLLLVPQQPTSDADGTLVLEHQFSLLHSSWGLCFPSFRWPVVDPHLEPLDQVHWVATTVEIAQKGQL